LSWFSKSFRTVTFHFLQLRGGDIEDGRDSVCGQKDSGDVVKVALGDIFVVKVSSDPLAKGGEAEMFEDAGVNQWGPILFGRGEPKYNGRGL
jgi:hypothetical protein